MPQPQPPKQRIPTLTAPARSPTLRAVARKAARRMVELLLTMDVEIGEVCSLGNAVAWLVPLLWNPRFLSTSVYLRQAEYYFPRPALVAATGALATYQIACLVLGGSPSALINSSRDQGAWFFRRQIGCLLGIVFWGAMSALFTLIALTPGTISYALITAGCFWSFWRFESLRKMEHELMRLRRIAADAEALSRTPRPAVRPVRPRAA